MAGLGAGWLLLVRLGWAEAARHEPAGAALCLFLTVALALPPVPARGGGGGPVVLRYWGITDHLGGAAVWVGEGGAPYRETVYTPFGKIHAEASSGTTPPRIFAGCIRLRIVPKNADEISDIASVRGQRGLDDPSMDLHPLKEILEQLNRLGTSFHALYDSPLPEMLEESPDTREHLAGTIP